MDVGFLEFIRELDGLQIIGVFFILIIVTVFTTRFKDIIKFLRKKEIKIEAEEVKLYKIQANLVVKTMNRCMCLLLSVIPNGINNKIKFTEKEAFDWELVLACAFMGPCRTYCTNLATSKDWGKMSPAQFAEICQNEPKWIMDTVTQECISLLKRQPNTIPMPFNELSIHNRDIVGAKCVEYIVEHFTELRNL